MAVTDRESRAVRWTVAGSIVHSEDVPAALRRWRDRFAVSQRDVAGRMGVRQSVISDYENGRRANPGAEWIKSFVNALVDIAIEPEPPPSPEADPSARRGLPEDIRNVVESYEPEDPPENG
jgi:predicted transcriptional regulator